MRAAVLQEPGQPLAVVDLDDPTPAPGELLVRVDACGVCGSDLHLSDALPLPGLVLGHEYSGTVVDTGRGVSGWEPGTAVTALSLATCGQCAACLSGRVRKCESAIMIGVERPGAYAEYLTVPAHDALRLPEGFDTHLGALVEPLAVALHTIDRADIRHDSDVLVLGAGPIGLAVVAWLTHLGVRSVVVSDPTDARRALAETLGATALDPASTDVADGFRDLAGTGPGIVIECVGIPGLVQHATEVADTDATVVVAGVCMGPDTVVPWTAMSKELDMRYAFYYRRQDFTYTIDMIHSGRLEPRSLVTSEVDLDGLPGSFSELKSPDGHGQAKVLVRP